MTHDRRSDKPALPHNGDWRLASLDVARIRMIDCATQDPATDCAARISLPSTVPTWLLAAYVDNDFYRRRIRAMRVRAMSAP